MHHRRRSIDDNVSDEKQYQKQQHRRDHQRSSKKRRKTSHRRGERADDGLDPLEGNPMQRRPHHYQDTREPPAVSEDELDLSTTTNNNNARHRSKSPRSFKRRGRRNTNPNRSPSSHHDDTVGHFRGGPGTVIGDRYLLERQVGLGTFGRVVECLDLQSRSHRRGGGGDGPGKVVAIKIVRNVKRYCESAKIEASIVRQINRRSGRGRSHCVILDDAFSDHGHFCLVFESLGPSLYDFMKRHDYRPFPMICIQDFAVQLLETLEFLHSFGLIHTDLKIENILLTSGREITYRHQRVPESTRIKLIDFGGACYDDSKKSSVINTRQYRAPEVILEAGWSMPSDIWSLGCILAELYKGELLFPTHENLEHLALIERALGQFPRSILRRGTKFVSEAFDADGRHRMSRVLSEDSAAYVRNAPSLDSVVRNPEDGWFLRLLSDILQIDPEKRATAFECLNHLGRIQRNIVRCA